jgi:hypothetical protein
MIAAQKSLNTLMVKCEQIGIMNILIYVCKQQSAVYFLLQQAQRALLFNVSNFQLSKLSSMRNSSLQRIWSRFESAHGPIFFLPIFPFLVLFLFLQNNFKVIKSVYFLQKVKKTWVIVKTNYIIMKGSVRLGNNVPMTAFWPIGPTVLRFTLHAGRRVFWAVSALLRPVF